LVKWSCVDIFGGVWMAWRPEHRLLIG
jgi:hypothetical protein